MHSSPSSPSLTAAVRVLNSHTNASITGASDSLRCVHCGGLGIVTALKGLLCQIASIPSVLDSNILKSYNKGDPGIVVHSAAAAARAAAAGRRTGPKLPTERVARTRMAGFARQRIAPCVLFG
jgi:hypothetical protein